MSNPNRPRPAQTGDAAFGGPATRPVDGEPAATSRDPVADPDTSRPSGGESKRGDPDALDQSVGREDAGQGDARTRDGAI